MVVSEEIPRIAENREREQVNKLENAQLDDTRQHDDHFFIVGEGHGVSDDD